MAHQPVAALAMIAAGPSGGGVFAAVAIVGYTTTFQKMISVPTQDTKKASVRR
jgi:hypothetical protein